MTDTTKNNGIKGFLIETLADPVLIYVVILVMSVMYHYRSSLAFTFGLITYVVGWFLFRLFDFMKKHKFIGGTAYIIICFIALRLVTLFDELGSRDYPIDFTLWFITPQDSLLYNKYYTLMMFVMFLIFMASVFYYFTRCIYRVFMTFLILIIPFAIYGKEYEEMPIGYILALAVGYVVIMALFLQLRETDDTKVVNRPDTRRSLVAFAALFAVAAALIPKPQIEANRDVLETLINADALTDRLDAMLNVFRDSTTGEQFRSRTSDNVLYYVKADEPLRLKTYTFSTYNYREDSWSIGDLDNRYTVKTHMPVEILVNGEISDAVCFAAAYDEDFAADYGFEDIAGAKLEHPEEKEIRVYAAYIESDTSPVPQGANALTETSYEKEIGLTHAGAITTDEGEQFKVGETFRYTYIPEGTLGSLDNLAIIDRIAGVDDYEPMLDRARELLLRASEDDSLDEDAQKLALRYNKVLYASCRFFTEHDTVLLDYGGNERIKALAEEVTEGLATDHEKAIALMFYFYNNKFKYDVEYRKAKGDNAETFLFDSHTGVCYEYATAMTLMARAVGIPARFCEGYGMQTVNTADSGGSYIVSAKDAHAYPELYIKGYGWVSYEPTLTDDTGEKNNRQAAAMLSKFGIVLLIICSIALVIMIVYPYASHKFFVMTNKKRSPNKAAAAVIRRVCRLYEIPPTSTAHEAEAAVGKRSGADISAAAALFDKAEYGGAELTENDRSKAMEEYISAYNALRDAKKAERKARLGRKKKK